MATDSEKAEVKLMIQGLYKLAGIPVWDGEVNDGVAEVFGIMLHEVQQCSKAFGWVPKPPGGKASIAWLAFQLGRGIFNSTRHKISATCARAVIAKWRTPLELAAQGIATLRRPTWA
jgi:hypothetical protein